MKNFFALLLLFAALLLARASRTQVGIGTATPDVSAALEVRASNKGVLFPQLSLRNLNDGTVAGGTCFYYAARRTTQAEAATTRLTDSVLRLEQRLQQLEATGTLAKAGR